MSSLGSPADAYRATLGNVLLESCYRVMVPLFILTGCLGHSKKPKWAKPWDRPCGQGRKRHAEEKNIKMVLSYRRLREKFSKKHKGDQKTSDVGSDEHSEISKVNRTAKKIPRCERRIPRFVGGMVNHYAVLQIRFNATDKEIKKAYRALSLRHHPDKIDKNTGNRIEAEELFLSLKQAHDALLSEKRRKYNRELADAIARELFPGRNVQRFAGDLRNLERVYQGRPSRRAIRKAFRKRKKSASRKLE